MSSCSSIDRQLEPGAKSVAKRKSKIREASASNPVSLKNGGIFSVFVSHATYDKWVAKVLCEKIASLGSSVQPWRDDRDIDGGEIIPDTIRTAIQECDEFLVLLTPESVQRQWVLVEIGAAWGQHLRIVPILYHVTAELIPAAIRLHRGYQLGDFDEYLEGLSKRIKTL
jgi:hypothetical protein